MGTRMSPSYAKLFMAKLEESFLCRESTLKPYVLWRYIGDIFVIICQHGEENLRVVMDDLNSFRPSSSLPSGRQILSPSSTLVLSCRMARSQWIYTPNLLIHISTLQQTAAIHATVNHQFHSAKPWESAQQTRTLMSTSYNTTSYVENTRNPFYVGR